MYRDCKIVAIIPARAGSKGLPQKNKLLLCGKPLIQYSIETALSSRYIDTIVVTSDDDDILTLCRDFPVLALKRPCYLSDDTSSTADVVTHTLSFHSSFDYFTLLQPTSPLRNSSDIDSSIENVHDCDLSSCVSISRSKLVPNSLFRLKNNLLHPFIPRDNSQSTRRQDQEPFFYVNGSIYTVRISTFISNPVFIFPDTFGLLIPPESSIDIDSKLDFDLASLSLSS